MALASMAWLKYPSAVQSHTVKVLSYLLQRDPVPDLLASQHPWEARAQLDPWALAQTRTGRGQA